MVITAFLCVVFGGLMVLVMKLVSLLRRPGKAAQTPPAARNAVQMECTVCHRELVFGPAELSPLTPVEAALCVRSKPGITGRKLAEYVCPYCEAAHCFGVDVSPPEWLGVNFYQPQGVLGHCYECKQPLRNPVWPSGKYDHRIKEVPELAPEHGLICSRCGAVCCVSCCRQYTACRAEKTAEDYLCPRCGRGPIDTFYHP